MAFIDWDIKYETGIVEMDQHHQKLLNMINQLYDEIFSCTDLEQERELTRRVLAELIDYTKYHFAAEEAFLKAESYPDLPAQQKEHALLLIKVKEIETKATAGALSLSLTMFDLLRDWLTGHIVGSDKKYGAFLANRFPE